MMAIETIQLTKDIRVNSGSHILYFYEDCSEYIANVCSFILTGFELGQHIIYIDAREHYDVVLERIAPHASEQMLGMISYLDNKAFYRVNHTIDVELIFQNFVSAVQPFLEGERSVRAWGHVDYQSQEELAEKLHAYECKSDIAINQLGVLTVCAYPNERINGKLQTRMMRTHEYMMTDDEFVRSSLYQRSGKSVVFPSLSQHAKIQNEMDLYKQKLDFVHVVSHEVRNPLTVINAYAAMLQKEELSAAAKRKLKEIQDYVTVIDSEITHIINTEQMLTSDALWRKSAVSPKPVVQGSVEIMRTKARTQNIELQATLGLTGKEVMNSNIIGLRLIISNLLSNAIKYSEEGSSVVFEAFVQASELILRIKDDGEGMTEEQLQRLFEKYQKMNTEKSGQGVGLFMVKKLVDHFEGTIVVQSEPMRGTRVTVVLPLLT